MRLADGEMAISRFSFTGSSDDQNNMSVLTDRRLVVIYKNGEESYPLTKITAVKFYEYYEWWKIILGGLISLWGTLAFLASIILLIISVFSKDSNPTGAPSYAPILIIAELCFAFFVGYKLLLKPGLEKKTKLAIGHMGGSKKYTVKKSEALIDFIEEINKKLQ